MSAPPYMPLFVGDYLADTTHLTCTEHGAYMLLLMAMWRAGGSLPDDPSKLARFARCTTGQWARMSDAILAFFDREDGVIVHGRLTRSHTERRDVRREYNPDWQSLREDVLKRDGYACVYCGDVDGPFEAGHVVPVCAGGADDADNLVCACRTCNRSKGAKTLEAWRATWA